MGQAQVKAVKGIAVLLLKLPQGQECRVIFMRRPVTEVISSRKKMLRKHGQHLHVAEESRLEEMLNELVDDVLGWLARQRNIRTLFVDYLDVVKRPSRVIPRIQEFLVRDLDMDQMAKADDPRLSRNRTINLGQ